MKNKTYNKKKVLFVFVLAVLLITGLVIRLGRLMIVEAPKYQKQAEELHEREREIKAARGEIVDRNGVVLATNETVCTVSVIFSQIKDSETVIHTLAELLELDIETVRKKVETVSSMEKIKTNVPKEIGDQIRAENLEGVKVDEDFKRYYPYGELASKVLGFTGGDNQGIIGLEVEYEEYLKGTNGNILTTTDAKGVELEGIAEERQEPIDGKTLQITLDYNIQMYIQQTAEKLMEEKQAEAVQAIAINPQNGEVLAMVNVPEFDLNNPFELPETYGEVTDEERQELLNQIWRNGSINDTYEPGSTFKMITSAAALEEGVVGMTDSFYCPGYRVVEDRIIRCHETDGHGQQTFVEGVQNSCNPVFIDIGMRLGVGGMYNYFNRFGLLSLTNIDLPGEAGTIMHAEDNIKAVELATISFGQSFQVTPIQMATTVSSLINGGVRVTPHFGKAVLGEEGDIIEEFEYGKEENVVSEEVSESMQDILESVVSQGSGRNAFIEGYEIGGKTATSQTLPRSANKYISSFIGFAPAGNPEILIVMLVHDPQGIYYGGTIVAPVVGSVFDNVLPYLGIEKNTLISNVEETQVENE